MTDERKPDGWYFGAPIYHTENGWIMLPPKHDQKLTVTYYRTPGGLRDAK